MVSAELKRLIEDDIKFAATPDLPQLRYFGGPIPVFLWDDNKDLKNICSILGEYKYSENCSTKYTQAFTERKYIPWYNLQPSETYPAYCLEEHEDVDFLDIPEYSLGMPLQLKGKVVDMSLGALTMFDYFYDNGHYFERTKIKVYPNKHYGTPITCFAYLNNIDQVTEFDSSKSEYTIHPDMDFTPFRDNEEGQYEF